MHDRPLTRTSGHLGKSSIIALQTPGHTRRGEQGRAVVEALLLPFLAILILLIIWLISNSAGSGFLGFASGSAQQTPPPIVSATLPATWTVTNTLPPQTGTPQATRPTATSLIPSFPPRFPIATETPQPGPILPPSTPTPTHTPNHAATLTALWDDYWATETAAWDNYWATQTAIWTGEGTATISPASVSVGSSNTLVIEYTAGPTSFVYGEIAIIIPSTWSPPQIVDSSGEGFIQVVFPVGATYDEWID